MKGKKKNNQEREGKETSKKAKPPLWVVELRETKSGENKK